MPTNPETPEQMVALPVIWQQVAGPLPEQQTGVEPPAPAEHAPAQLPQWAAVSSATSQPLALRWSQLP